MGKEKLTRKQRVFIEHYLANGFHGTKAAAAAGYSGPKDAAARLTSMPKILAAIDEARKETVKNLEISKESVIRELGRIAFSDIRKVAKWEGDSVKMLSSDQIDDDTAASIQSITLNESQSQGGSRSSLSIKQYDKVKALELLGKYFALWQEQPQQNNTTINILNQFKAMSSPELIKVFEENKRKILGENTE